MTVRAPLSSSSLLVALNAIATAKTPEECGQALVTGATLVQDAIAIRQAPHEVQAALNACPDELGQALGMVLDRAVSIHHNDDGSALALWLLPVVVSCGAELPSMLRLEQTSMSGLKLAAYLQEQLGLPPAKNGWVSALPVLYHNDQLKSSDLGALVDLPHLVRESIRGTGPAVNFGEAEAMSIGAGVALYHLPVVAHHPAGTDIILPAPSDKTTHRATKWVTDTLNQMGVQDVAIHVAPTPRVFADAFVVGERLKLDVEIRERIMQVCDETGMQPNGLAALVAPYVTRQMDDGTHVLGVSLVSRLTTSFIATISLPFSGITNADHDEVALIGRILQELGMQVVQMRSEAIETISCQHCGHLQYSMPAVQHNNFASANGARAH